jgi:SpoVK/Ycf46/Vps4 family AAA+-type ATPase
MRYEQTQIGKLTEQVKLAVLSNTPIVYIPTQQMEVIQEMLFSKESANSIIPRLRIKDNEITELDSETFEENGKLIVDNYQVVQSFEASNIDHYPMLYIIYMRDGKEWDASVTASLTKFVRQYLGIKNNKNYIENEKKSLTSKSLCLVVSPTYISVPSKISPYTKTVYLEPLSDEEIENIMISSMKEQGIDPQIIMDKEDLFRQMKVSFRGMSALKIRQLMGQIIKCQLIDFEGVIESEVMTAIQNAKKELLNNCLGLKWENTSGPDAIGLENVTTWLNEHAVLFKDPERAVKQHVDIPKGILITGIPGSGKSLMAKTAARILNNMPLISLNMGMLRGGVVGESEHNLENALRTAENMAPCVLWIDEIEKAMSGSSGNGNGDSGVGQRMFGTFLTWMQEKSSACFVFATSNDISHLPPELFRSERFDRKFFTFMPMAQECARIFSGIIHSQNRQYDAELRLYDKKKRKEMSQRLFDERLECSDTWVEILNTKCSERPQDCILKKGKDGKMLWYSGRKPSNKLLTGADISSIIKEAKFRCKQDANKKEVDNVYNFELFKNTVQGILSEFKPYGETNLPSLAKSFLDLYQNQFEPASESFILKFSDFDEIDLLYTPTNMDENGNIEGVDAKYDMILFHTLVGAINHYLPILEKKGLLS